MDSITTRAPGIVTAKARVTSREVFVKDPDPMTTTAAAPRTSPATSPRTSDAPTPAPGPEVTRGAVLALSLGAFGVYLASAPRLLNGDGLGYLKSVAAGAPPPPGHVLYLVVLEGLARALHATAPLAMLGPARVLSAACGAIAIALFVALAREVGLDRRATILGALGLAVSWGLWQEADDIESYAPALAALVAAVTCALRAGRTRRVLDGAAAGLTAALAILFHIAIVLLLPFLAFAVLRRSTETTKPRGPLAATVAAVVAGAAGLLGPLAAVAFGSLHLHGIGGPGGALSWLLGANHGFRYPLHPYTPLVALWGLARTFAYAPFPTDAPLAVVIAESAGAGLALVAIGLLVLRRPAPSRLGRLGVALWAAPTAALGVYYYGSDTERWIFLLPLLWLLVAAAPPRRVALLLAALCVWNLAVEVVPDAVRSTERDQAAAAGAPLEDGDLVIGPGHGWDEYVGFYEGKAVRMIPLAYFAGATGSAAGALTAMDGEIDRALAAGRHVYAARVFLPGERDRTDGWKELALFHLGRAEVQAELVGRYQVPQGALRAADLVPIAQR